MIKPVNISNMGIEPIKVPNQNNVSFGGLSKYLTEGIDEFTKKAQEAGAKKFPQKAMDFLKKIPEIAKKAGKFIAKKAIQLKDYILKSASDFADATKNPAKKSRTLRKLTLGIGATTAAGVGGATTKKVMNRNKKDSE